ncbi:MAG: 4Fe-4S binding protein [Saprospiraceae bacterium]|nr:4Fe-4S binding protein [Saprospiraceae bacterium]
MPEYLLKVETALCDGLFVQGSYPRTEAFNLFGRRVEMCSSSESGRLVGWAGSGWRVAGFLSDPRMLSLENRRQIVQQQLPVVLHVPCFAAGFEDWIILQAIDALDAVRLTILAHRVAERALLPVVVITDPGFVLEENLPDLRPFATFLGASESLIKTPTPAQEIVFGPRRRCIPNQFSFDQPVVRGAAASLLDAQRSTLARRRFVGDHILPLLGEAEAALQSILPGHHGAIVTQGSDKSDHLLLVFGSGARQALNMPTNKSLFRGTSMQYAAMRILHPWPSEELSNLTKKKKSWTSLLPLDARNAAWRSLSDRLLAGSSMPPSIGYYRPELTPEGIYAVTENMTPGHAQMARFFLDMTLHPARSGSAQQEVMIHALERAYPDLDTESLLVGEESTPAQVDPGHFHQLPEIVREQEDHGPPYSRLARFYQDAIVGQTDQTNTILHTDPFRIQGVMPPLADLLRVKPKESSPIAVLEPVSCTGCGQCLVQCPFAAMPSLAIRMEDLLRAGMAHLSRNGQALSAMTPVVKNLAIFWSARCTADAFTGQVMGEVRPALKDLLTQMKADPEKRQKIQTEFDILHATLDQMPWAKTRLYFDGPEAQQAGRGELFSIAIDPHACTGCGICVDACPEDALSMGQGESFIASALSAYQLWEQLPDTSAATIARMHADPEAAPLSGIMLSRHYYQSIIGGESKPELWGTRMILHAAGAVAESVMQPRWHQWLTELATLRTEMDEQVRHHLQQAMPGTLDPRLEQLLDKAGHKQVSLNDLLTQLTSEETVHQRIDTGKLRRWIHLGRELAQLEQALKTGTTGAGRARYGVFLGGRLADDLVQYPHHPFQVPVWIEPEVNVEQIQAILDAQQRNILDQVRLLRRAGQEAKGQYRPEIQDEGIAAMTWADLSAKEKELLPPLVIVLDARDLQALPTKDLIALLSEDAPVKILSIQRHIPGPAETYERQGWVLPIITSRVSPVFQTAPSRGAHFSSSLQQIFHAPGPALIHALGYSEASQQNRTWLDRMDELVVAGLFPLLSWVPRGAADYLSQDLEITSIPDLAVPVDSLVPEWVQQEWEAHGQGHTHWKDLLSTEWRTWLEWSGRQHAGETDNVKETRKGLEEGFAAERQRLQQEHQAALQDLRQGLQEEVRVQLADRLYQLAQSQRGKRIEEVDKMDRTS